MLTLGLGAAPTAIRRAGLFVASAIPGWVPAGSLAFYDFQNDRAYANGATLVNSTTALTTSRASIGYDLAATTQFAANVARRTGAGLLIEAAGTNILFPSQPPNTLPAYSASATWYLPGGTWTPNNAVAPDGTTTAGTLALSANTQGIAYQLPGSGSRSAAWFVKGPAGAQIYLHGDGGANPRNRVLWTFTGGWDRPQVPQFTMRYLYLTTQDLGAGTAPLPAVTFQVWQAGIEATAAPSSLIPTTTAAATRAADSITLTLPTSTTKVDLAYDNGTTNTVTTGAGTYTIPVNPAGTNLKSLRAY